MVKDDSETPMCPYCGSKKLIRVDWGFANWECETCRNNFKTPYYNDKNDSYGSSSVKGNSKNPSISDKIKDNSMDFFMGSLKYFIIAVLVLGVIGSIIFIVVRLYQVISMSFL